MQLDPLNNYFVRKENIFNVLGEKERVITCPAMLTYIII